MRVICLSIILGFGGFVNGTQTAAEGSANAKAILEKAVTAAGGREKLAQMQRCYSRTRIVIGESSGVLETWLELPEREKKVARYTEDGKNMTQIRVVNGKDAWRKMNNEDTRQENDDAVSERHESLFQNRILLLYPLLEDPKLIVTSRGDIDVEGRRAHCLSIKSNGRQDMELFFDTATSMLTKYSFRSVNPQIKGKRIDVYQDGFREIGGFKLPVRVTIRIDGELLSTDELLEYRALKSFPERTFAKP